MKKRNKIIGRLNNLSKLIILTIIYELAIYLLSYDAKDYLYVLIPFSVVYLILITIICLKTENRKELIFYCIFFVGVILRTIYILKTGVHVRQHDVLDFGERGHLDYIYTLYLTHHLPLTNEWQFYHPPLWHILGAIWLAFIRLFQFDLIYSIEGIQILSVLFSSFMIVVANKICLKLKIDNKYRFLVDTLVAVNPALIGFSGVINNDCLLVFLEALVILKLFDWYDETSVKNTIKLAIVTGLCVMTKMNGAIMAIPIIYVFVKKIIEDFKKNKKSLKNNISKITLFGIISLPIGLWYQVRSWIKFSNLMVPRPGDWLYTGDHSIVSRFLSLNINQLFNYADMDTDYNLPSFLIRSEIFGEFHFDISKVLFSFLIALLCIMIICFIVGSVKYLFEKKNIYNNVLIITWYVSIASSVIFYYNYPYACSMDYRYVAICLLCSNVFIGYIINKLKNKPLKILIEIICVLYVICNIIFALQVK